MSVPDRANDPARVVSLKAEADKRDEPLTAPPPMHPYYEGRRRAAERKLQNERQSSGQDKS